MPDHRQPSPNTRYTIQDAVVGAFGIFFTQSPSFLEYQRRLPHTQRRHNAQTLLGVEQSPCDKQVRPLLEPLTPSYLAPVVETIFQELEQHGRCDHFRVLGDHRLVALAGTTSFASKTIHGPPCLTRQLTHGHTLSSHTALTPVIVCSGRPDVIALPPEYILPQAGEAQQDGEQQAGKRGLSPPAQAVAPPQMTIRGDALYSKQPVCAWAQHQGLHGILTCQPDTHPTFYERFAFWQANDRMAERERT